VHGEADHLHLRAELGLARRAGVLEPLHGHRGAVGEAAAVHVPEPAFAQDVLGAEPVRGRLQLTQAELAHVPEPRHHAAAVLQVAAATLCNSPIAQPGTGVSYGRRRFPGMLGCCQGRCFDDGDVALLPAAG
jgi:hypothetical protein